MLLCTTCNWTAKYYASRKVRRNSKVSSCYEVNVRAVMATGEIGRSHTALEKLCGFLNLPEHPHATTISDMQKNIVDAYNK